MRIEVCEKLIVLEALATAGWTVAGIDAAGIAGEYDDEGAANSDGRAPRVGPEAAFGEGVYAGGGSFMPGREGFVRGA